MKYLFIIPSLKSGGAERVMATLANDFVQRGDVVEFILFSSEERFFYLNKKIKVEELNLMPDRTTPMKLALTVPIVEGKRFLKIVRLIEEIAPDVVLSFCNTANIFNSLQKIWFNRNITAVISERSDPEKYGGFLQWCCKHLFTKADALICQTAHVAEYYRKYNGNCYVLPNPVHMDSLPNTIVKNKEKYFAAVGRLTYEKNFDMLIRAFAEFNKYYCGYKLKIYGEGILKEELKALIRKLNLEKCVELRGNKEHVMKHINDASCLVLSSRIEGFPNVLVEAMCSGIPVISTNLETGAAGELIQEGENGYIVPIGDEKALCESLIKIVEEADLEKMAINNYRMREKYNENAVVEQWHFAFHEIINR